jgi:hypothetical protein
MPERFLDVSHEALIRGWPRLRGWLDEDRAGLRLQRRITEAAEEWQRSNRDHDLLYRGARLIQAQEWRARREAELNPLEREFLDASIVLKQRVEEEKRLHEAESERVNLLLKKRRRARIFLVTVSVLGLIILIGWVGLDQVFTFQHHKLTEAGHRLRETAKAALATGSGEPTIDVAVLRNLATALSLNRLDTEAAKMARNLLLQRVWCPPAASEVRYPRDILLAATFAPGGSNSGIFVVAGDGLLLFWNGHELELLSSLFEKPKPAYSQQIVQPAFASFSPDGQWLLIIPPTLASAANAQAAGQGALPQAGPGRASGSGHEQCRVQTWRWSVQNRTYESVGDDLKIQRLRGSRNFNFAWSPESDRVVLINSRGTNEAECAFFELKGNTFQQLVEESNKLNSMRIMALAFAKRVTPETPQINSVPGYEPRSGIAAVSMDSAAPPLRKVSFIGADDLQLLPNAMNGQDSIRLSEDFQPDGVAFGPGNDQLTLTGWNDVRILDLRDGTVTQVPRPTFRDQFMRLVVGPGDFATRLVAKSLYGRVEVAKAARMQEPAEPIVFRGSIGIPQFSSDGQRLLILSGGIWNQWDTMRLFDVSLLYRTRQPEPENFNEKPAPPWLADIASAASALDSTGDGSFLTLEIVQKRYPQSKAGNAYEAVWKRFFPDEKSSGRLERQSLAPTPTGQSPVESHRVKSDENRQPRL